MGSYVMTFSVAELRAIEKALEAFTFACSERIDNNKKAVRSTRARPDMFSERQRLRQFTDEATSDRTAGLSAMSKVTKRVIASRGEPDASGL